MADGDIVVVDAGEQLTGAIMPDELQQMREVDTEIRPLVISTMTARDLTISFNGKSSMGYQHGDISSVLTNQTVLRTSSLLRIARPPLGGIQRDVTDIAGLCRVSKSEDQPTASCHVLRLDCKT